MARRTASRPDSFAAFSFRLFRPTDRLADLDEQQYSSSAADAATMFAAPFHETLDQKLKHIVICC